MGGGCLEKLRAEIEREMEEEKREREHREMEGDHSSETEREKERERDGESEMGCGCLEQQRAEREREMEVGDHGSSKAAEKIYDLLVIEENTPYTLRLTVEVKGERLEFRGDASAIFREAGANPLRNAKLRTPDLQALASRATLFVFHFRPSEIEVRFYDPLATTASPLGILSADPLPLEQSERCPRTGTGSWSIIF